MKHCLRGRIVDAALSRFLAPDSPRKNMATQQIGSGPTDLVVACLVGAGIGSMPPKGRSKPENWVVWARAERRLIDLHLAEPGDLLFSPSELALILAVTHAPGSTARFEVLCVKRSPLSKRPYFFRAWRTSGPESAAIRISS